MTTPLIPDFVIAMFENEIRGIIQQVIGIAVEQGAQHDTLTKLVEKRIGMSLKVVTEDKELVKIMRVKPRKVPCIKERCTARIVKNGVLCQCSFHQFEMETVCKKHMKRPTKWGLITDPPIPTPADNPLKQYTKIY